MTWLLFLFSRSSMGDSLRKIVLALGWSEGSDSKGMSSGTSWSRCAAGGGHRRLGNPPPRALSRVAGDGATATAALAAPHKSRTCSVAPPALSTSPTWGWHYGTRAEATGQRVPHGALPVLTAVAAFARPGLHWARWVRQPRLSTPSTHTQAPATLSAARQFHR